MELLSFEKLNVTLLNSANIVENQPINWCVKLNFSQWALPYGKRTNIFSMEDSLEIIEAYRVFLLTFFETVARTQLCSQAVQNQVIVLYWG